MGKVVRFRVLYTIPTGAKRDYGIVTLQNGAQLPEGALAEGWVKLRDDAGRKEENEEAIALLENLKSVEARARSEGKGLWQEGGSKIDASYDVSDPKALAEEYKGQNIDGEKGHPDIYQPSGR